MNLPIITGIDINRTSTPRFNKPNTNIIQPAKKAIKGAYAGSMEAYGWTIKAIIAVVAGK